MNKLILLTAILLFASSCIEKPAPTETPFKYNITTPTPIPPKLIENKTIIEKAKNETIIEKVSLDIKRQINQQKYYRAVSQNKTLVAYTKFGLYTQNFEEAKEMSEWLWTHDVLILDTIIEYDSNGNPRWKDVAEIFPRTEDPVLDYIKIINGIKLE